MDRIQDLWFRLSSCGPLGGVSRHRADGVLKSPENGTQAEEEPPHLNLTMGPTLELESSDIPLEGMGFKINGLDLSPCGPHDGVLGYRAHGVLK